MIGAASLAGWYNSLYAIVGGNYQLSVKLLESPTAEIYVLQNDFKLFFCKESPSFAVPR